MDITHPNTHINSDTIINMIQSYLADWDFSQEAITVFWSHITELSESKQLPPHLWCAEISLVIAHFLYTNHIPCKLVITHGKSPHIIVKVQTNENTLFIETEKGGIEFLESVPERHWPVLWEKTYNWESRFIDVLEWMDRFRWYTHCILHFPFKQRDYYKRKSQIFSKMLKNSIKWNNAS